MLRRCPGVRLGQTRGTGPCSRAVPTGALLAIPIVASIGLPGLPERARIALVAAAGFCLLGLQFGNIASESNFAAGRVGSVIGPIVGGFLIAMKLPTEYLFYIAAIPLAIGFINAAILTPLYRAELEQPGG